MKWITVSRKTGTRGSELARRVASELGYKFYGRAKRRAAGLRRPSHRLRRTRGSAPRSHGRFSKRQNSA